MLDWQGEKWYKKMNFKAKIYGKWATAHLLFWGFKEKYKKLTV